MMSITIRFKLNWIQMKIENFPLKSENNFCRIIINKSQEMFDKFCVKTVSN